MKPDRLFARRTGRFGPRTALLAIVSLAILGLVAKASAGLAPDLWYSRYLPAMDRLDRTVEVGGATRSYIAYVPKDARERGTLSVLFAFHPARGTGERFRQLTRFHTRDGIQDFIAVYPDGLYGNWNAGPCCGKARLENVDDIGFVEAILADLEAVAEISPDRNFATGFSNGAIMAHEVGCRLSDRFAAIAPVGATRQMPNGCDPRDPVSVLMIHGLADRHSPYEGGYSFEFFELYGLYLPSVANNVDFWRQRNGLVARPKSVTRLVKIACARSASGAAEVTECPVPELGHAWPGEDLGDRYSEIYGPQRPDLPATLDILQFFRSKL